MVHIPAKFQENTSIRFRVTVQKLNVTTFEKIRCQWHSGVQVYPVVLLHLGSVFVSKFVYDLDFDP